MVLGGDGVGLGCKGAMAVSSGGNAGWQWLGQLGCGAKMAWDTDGTG